MEADVCADRSKSVVVLELGCGTRVPSVRQECEDVVRDVLSGGGAATLVRINPQGGPPPCAPRPGSGEDAAAAAVGGAAEPHDREPQAVGPAAHCLASDGPTPELLSAHTVFIEDTALHALTRIDAIMRKLQ